MRENAKKYKPNYKNSNWFMSLPSQESFCKKHKINKDELKELITKKKNEFGGLLSEEGAYAIIVNQFEFQNEQKRV